MENKIIILLTSLILFSCDQGTTIQIINDTDSSVEIKVGEIKRIILPNDTYSFVTMGIMPPHDLNDENHEFIENYLKKFYKDGFYITYLENIYYLTPNIVTKLLIKNSTYKRNLGTYTYCLNLSEVINEAIRVE